MSEYRPTPPALDAARNRLTALAKFHREEQRLTAENRSLLDAAKINEAVAIAFEEVLGLLPAAVPGALDAEDRERLKRIASTLEDDGELLESTPTFLRRLASHQPEAQRERRGELEAAASVLDEQASRCKLAGDVREFHFRRLSDDLRRVAALDLQGEGDGC